MNSPTSQKELQRLEAVRSLEILDTPAENDFDDLVRLAAMIFDVPMSTVTIVDSHRQWFKAAAGLSLRETPRDISFCTHAVESHQPLVVEDTAQDPRFADNPLVLNAPYYGFYAGVPMHTAGNEAIGAFCIMDSQPRRFSQTELDILKVLANQAMKLIELHAERIKLRESEQRWKFALEGAGDGVWDWNIKTGQVIFSRQWKVMLGYDEHDLEAKFDTWSDLIHPEDRQPVMDHIQDYLAGKVDTYRIEHRLRCRDASWKWILTRGMTVSRDRHGQPLRMVGTHTDISERKASEDLIWRQANFDTLTGLPNRRMFFDRLKEQIKRASRGKKAFAVFFIDLDGFKEVNDTLGHRAGDHLLIEVSLRITQSIRASDTLARLGGDEFTIILNDIASTEAAGRIADKVLRALAQPIKLGKQRVTISGSIGIARYPIHGKDVDSLVNHADAAMYAAKAQGKSCWVEFPEALSPQAT